MNQLDNLSNKLYAKRLRILKEKQEQIEKGQVLCGSDSQSENEEGSVDDWLEYNNDNQNLYKSTIEGIDELDTVKKTLN